MMWLTNNVLVSLLLTAVGVILWKAVKLLWLRPKWIEKCLRQQGVKGNPYKPFLGDVRELIALTKSLLLTPINFSDDPLPRVAPYIYHMIQKYVDAGTSCFVWIGPIPWLITTEPEKIKEVLTRYQDFHKPDHPITQILMVGLYGQEGDLWAKHRKIINPAFHLDKLKKMVDTMYESCSIMTSSWDKIIAAHGGGPTEVDVWPFLETLAGDIISRAAFGSSYGDGKIIFDLQTEYVNLIMKNPQPSNYIPGWRFLPTKKNRRSRAISREVEGVLTRMIDSRKMEMEAGETTKEDLLGLLLESNKDHDGNEKGTSLTTKEVVEECKLFYLAGSETTLGLFAWTLVMLSKHLLWQHRARTEVFHVFGKHGTPNFDGLARLKTITMIIHEVLRLHSPAYMLMRKVHKDTKLGELLIPGGTEVLMPLCITHQDPSLWGEDAKEFNPERFAEGVSKATKGQAIYFPFSTGPRVCVGQNFSLLEAKLVLATLLQRFSFEVGSNYVHAPWAMLTMKPQHGVNLLLRKLPS
ncbi:cytochrome P450 72A397-like isoform X1 [Silene latifolia]|uniref:cytochrome P450 72A397-like isoform X1 n=1 Tax=Silene latifolia TaxID=37657 RepID=UPI003D76FE9C